MSTLWAESNGIFCYVVLFSFYLHIITQESNAHSKTTTIMPLTNSAHSFGLSFIVSIERWSVSLFPFSIMLHTLCCFEDIAIQLACAHIDYVNDNNDGECFDYNNYWFWSVYMYVRRMFNKITLNLNFTLHLNIYLHRKCRSINPPMVLMGQFDPAYNIYIIYRFRSCHFLIRKCTK